MKVLDLFSGIGGFSRGLEMAGGFETVAFCEIDPDCRKVLESHWPRVPIFHDIKTINAEMVLGLGEIDIICAGFPCQPFSVAGKQKGKEDERHLWPWIARIIESVRPRWVLLENVPGLRNIAADQVLDDLERQGYACWASVVGAWAVGSPHKRDRVWIVARKMAQPADNGQYGTKGESKITRMEQCEGWSEESTSIEQSPRGGPRLKICELGNAGQSTSQRHPGGLLTPQNGKCGSGQHNGDSLERSQPASAGGIERELADTASGGQRTDGIAQRNTGHADQQSETRWPSRPGESQHEWEEPRLTQQPLGITIDGLPGKLVRRANKIALKMAGNSVVPQVVALFGKWIKLQENLENNSRLSVIDIRYYNYTLNNLIGKENKKWKPIKC